MQLALLLPTVFLVGFLFDRTFGLTKCSGNKMGVICWSSLSTTLIHKDEDYRTMTAPQSKSLAIPKNGGWPQFQDTACVVIMAGGIGLSVNIICFSQTLHAQWQALVGDIPSQEVLALDATKLTLSEMGHYLATRTADMTVLSGTKAAMMAHLVTPAAIDALIATIPAGTVVVA